MDYLDLGREHWSHKSSKTHLAVLPRQEDIVAENVETEGQMAFLRDLGCDQR
jgi:hypothetical protein